MLSFWLAEQGLSISNNIRSLYRNLNFPETLGIHLSFTLVLETYLPKA